MESVPIVSTIGNFLTIALRYAIRITPMANVTVTTIGKPSGIAATAKLHIKEIDHYIHDATGVATSVSLKNLNVYRYKNISSCCT